MQSSLFHTPILSGENLLPLIPQRPPIVMVDRFYGITDDLSCTALTINSSNLFCENGVFNESGVTEHIAQSAAVRVGYIYSNKGESIPIGFIGSVDKMKFYALAKVGQTLHTIIKVEQEVSDITLISAKVYVEEDLVAEGQMKIFLKREV